MDDFMHSPIEDIVDYRACPDCSSPDEHLEHTLYDVHTAWGARIPQEQDY